MKVEMVSTQTIAPSSPTPDHLKRFTLSIFDQLAPPIYIPLILFYASTGGISVHEASDRLKKSLSLTLTSFFPFTAGGSNIRDNTIVDCADEGINYTEARVSCNLRDVLAPPDMEVLRRLLPAGSGELLVVQESVFECGGIAVGICFSHKMGDAASISCFLNSWAAACACGGDDVAAVAPEFNLGSLFPPLDTFACSSKPPRQETGDKCAFRRFVFSASKVATLKANSCSASVSNPTRIEAVSSLIWHCAMRLRASSTEPSKSSYGLAQTVNLRKRVNPPLPDTSFGNFVGAYISIVDNNEPKDLASLATKLRDAKEEYMKGYPTKLRGPEGSGLISAKVGQGAGFRKDGFTMYCLTSWCKFGLYEVDFGWGKPIWTSIYEFMRKNGVVLLDARDGVGIEAWLSFPEDVMLLLEQHQYFLSFASPNPAIKLE